MQSVDGQGYWWLVILFCLEFEDKDINAESPREGSNHRFAVRAKVLQLLAAILLS